MSSARTCSSPRRLRYEPLDVSSCARRLQHKRKSQIFLQHRTQTLETAHRRSQEAPPIRKIPESTKLPANCKPTSTLSLHTTSQPQDPYTRAPGQTRCHRRRERRKRTGRNGRRKKQSRRWRRTESATGQEGERQAKTVNLAEFSRTRTTSKKNAHFNRVPFAAEAPNRSAATTVTSTSNGPRPNAV